MRLQAAEEVVGGFYFAIVAVFNPSFVKCAHHEQVAVGGALRAAHLPDFHRFRIQPER